MTARPAWAEVDLGAIEANAAALVGLVGPGTGLCAVVKGDGYGHGAEAAARAALAGGASCLAVALVGEGLALRRAGIEAPILVLGAPQPEEAADLVGAGLEASVSSASAIAALAAAAGRAGVRVRLHLKVDTGMRRLGCGPGEAATLASLIASEPSCELAGVYSHFADADEEDQGFARSQLAAFLTTLASIEGRGIRVPTRHIANSAAALWFPESRLDLVRSGIAIYGLHPHPGRSLPGLALRPALAIKARVTRVAEVEAGDTVSYGRTWRAARASRVATLPLGYADGYPRLLSNRAWAGFRGLRLPVVGRVCMDMCLLDATEAPELGPGSEVTLMGPGGPSLEEVAGMAGTINYEIACLAGLRLPRIPVGGAAGAPGRRDPPADPRPGER